VRTLALVIRTSDNWPVELSRLKMETSFEALFPTTTKEPEGSTVILEGPVPAAIVPSVIK